MNPSRWQKVEEIFNAVVELAPEEREGFLSAACGDDEELRAQIERLLRADEKANSFIESPVPVSHITRLFDTTIIEQNGSEMVGRQIGAYEIAREIGRGGMGAVYLAQRVDHEFHHRVAIKLIKRGMDTDFILKRFRNERQILASLNHPNIARLLDGGTTDDGLPYFVMEYIEGQPITKYCDARKLSIRERLRLFVQVCSAISYAHKSLVIHRDIKPGNILVTEDGVPKLLDFGIAKILNPELAHDTLEPTATAVRLMTPEYASPEQVRGERVSHASDQYSLGVLLYELITGHRPYGLRHRLPHEVARIICEEEPERPSTAISRIEEIVVHNDDERQAITPELVSRNRGATPETLRREIAMGLDNIVMQTLHKYPRRRYVSVEELSQDIERYLSGGTIHAPAYIPATGEREALREDEQSAGPARKSLAILPLKVLRVSSTEDTSGNYLSLGLADALITRLSNIRSLTIRPTSSVLKYSETTDALKAGKELNVGFVLDGRIIQASERIRITVQLINVKTESPQWAAQFDEKLTDILSLQDALSEQVAQAIIKNLSGAELGQLAKRGTDNLKAYESYLRGRYYWHSYTEAGLAKAIRCFYEAIALDPNFAAAYSGVADYHTFLGITSVLPPSECFLAAKEAATRALELDDKLTEAFASLGLVAWAYDWDVEESERLFKRSFELNPNYAQAHEWYAHVCASQGRFDEAVREMQTALRIDPQSAQLHSMTSYILYQARRFDESANYLDRAIELEPDNYVTLQGFGWIYPVVGKAKDAIAPSRKAVEISGRAPLPLWTLTDVLIRAGEIEEANRLLDELHALESKRYIAAYYFATIYTTLGEQDKAFEYLKKTLDQREYWAQWLNVTLRLDPLRDDPRFAELLKRVNPSRTQDTGEIKKTSTQPYNADKIISIESEAQVRNALPISSDEKQDVAKMSFYRRLSPLQWSSIVFIVLLLSSVGGWFLYKQFSKTSQPRRHTLQNLTNNVASDRYPKLSPDGQKIAFISNRDGGPEVYTMNADGSDVKRLTFNSAEEVVPAWTPDGKKIVYDSTNDTGTESDIWIMDADGSNQTNLTKSEGYDSRAAVSPDGKSVVFSSNRHSKEKGLNAVSPHFAIYLMNIDGGDQRRLTNDTRFETEPSWSPDGRIAFARVADNEKIDIFVMNADGTKIVNLINTPDANESCPVWSPDGKLIAFHTDRNLPPNRYDIFVMNADGSNARSITDHKAVNIEPSWTPDNRSIVFNTTRDGNGEIYITDIDPGPQSENKSIAVLPFKTESTDEATQSVGVGLSDALTTRLGQLKQLSVSPSSAARRYLEGDKDAQRVGHELGVEFIVSGTLQRDGNRLRVSAEMIQVKDRKILWAEKFDEEFRDIFTLQNSIAERVLQSLTIELTGTEAKRFNKRYTEDTEAYQFYLVGHYHQGNRSVDGLNKAIEGFNKAIRRDERFALAYAGLADCYALLALYQMPPPPDAYKRAKEFATKAIALDDSLAEAHASLAYVKFYYDEDRAASEREFRRAIELNPSYATAHHWFGQTLAAMGRHVEAQSEMKLAQQLDPRSAIIKSAAAMVFYYARQYDEALTLAQQSLELNPGLVPAHRVMRWTYQVKGDFDKAFAAYQNEKSFSGSAGEDWPVILAQVHAIGGRFEEAKLNIELGVRSAPVKRDPAFLAYDIAIAYALLDQYDQAFVWLEKAQALKSHGFNYALVDPRLDKLRSDPRFNELAKKAKLAS